MKKLLAVTLILLLLCGPVACKTAGNGMNVDLNMTTINNENPSMIYVLAMQINQKPAEYIGKTVCVEGYLEESDGVYGKVTCYDVSFCCYESLNIHIENVSDLPEENKIVRVTGTIAAYEDDPDRPVCIEASKVELAHEYYDWLESDE